MAPAVGAQLAVKEFGVLETGGKTSGGFGEVIPEYTVE
jgi:hypothetical protein